MTLLDVLARCMYVYVCIRSRSEMGVCDCESINRRRQGQRTGNNAISRNNKMNWRREFKKEGLGQQERFHETAGQT